MLLAFANGCFLCRSATFLCVEKWQLANEAIRSVFRVTARSTSPFSTNSSILVGAVLEHIDLDIWVGCGKAGDQVSKEAGAKQRGKPQRDSAGANIVGELYVFNGLLVDLQQLRSAFLQSRPSSVRFCLHVEGVEQLGTQLLLQLLNSHGKRRL